MNERQNAETVRAKYPPLTAEDWEKAVWWIWQHYPENVFPATGTSQDAKSGVFARQLCQNIVDRALHYAAERQSDGEV